MQEHLEITKYSHAELLELIAEQFFQGDYINHSLLFSLFSSLDFKQAATDNTHLQEVIDGIWMRCNQECVQNPPALVLRGYLSHFGIGSPINYPKAINDYEQAIFLDNNPVAMTNRACMYEEGMGDPVDFAKAITLYEQASALGNSTAMTNRALMHYNGKGGPVDFAKAIALDEQAIALGNSHAMTNRALMYEEGMGGPVDFAKAIALYEQAIALENSTAMTNRALMYQDGKGGPVDFVQAIVLDEQAIALGNLHAMTNRALMYEEGMGGPVDFAKAIALYEQAIVLGHAKAMNNRALMHHNGKGGPVDFAKAIALLEQATALGNGVAMYNQAAIYQNGSNGSVDLARATILYEQAIRSGIYFAQKNLQGIDIAQDTASSVLSLIWNELVDGTSFSMHTLSALSMHCKKTVLDKINTSYLGTSLSFLKQLKINPKHPLGVIINDGKINQESAELKKLMKQARTIIGERQGFFHGQLSPPLPPEIKNNIFSFLHPGINHDLAEEPRQKELNRALNSASAKEDLAAIKLLMESAPNNRPSGGGVYEALMTAVEMGYLLVIKQLGSYINLDNEYLETLLNWAHDHKREEIITWLDAFKAYSDYRKIIAMAQNPIDKIRTLLNHYAQNSLLNSLYHSWFGSPPFVESIKKLLHQIDDNKINEVEVMYCLKIYHIQLKKTDPLAQIIQFINEMIYIDAVSVGWAAKPGIF